MYVVEELTMVEVSGSSGGQSDKAVQPKLTHNYCIAKLNLKKSEYNIQKPGCG